MTTLRDLPSVDELLQTKTAAELITRFGRPLTLAAIRETLDKIRTRFSSGAITALPLHGLILTQADSLLNSWTKPTLRLVINATGVILHTNLGRAPLSDATIRAMDIASRGYSDLEYDLEKGARGSRFIHAESVLQKLTGAESAFVVNNNASAVLLILSALANRKRVIISRSQLVEIGGGFRIPDVMKQSGAKLVEVGATNKVHLRDYEEALQDKSALVMHAHSSNFKIIGFTEEPELKAIADLAHKSGVLVIDDLGSGALYDTAKYGLVHEPTVKESLAAGVDVVCFSGDKLLGGPQAGIIVGRKDLIEKIKKHPFARAVRADKTCLAGISATLLHYLKDEAEREIPILQMMSLTPKQVKGRVEAWIKELGLGKVMEGESTVGGGSLPGESFPTYLLSLTVESPDRFLKQLRAQNPPIIARTTNDKVLLDPRTVLPEQEGALLVGLKNVFEGILMKTELDALMQARNLDAFVVFGNAEHNPPMTYLTGGGHVSHATLIKKRGEEAVLFFGDMERDEAAKSGLKLIPYSKYDMNALIKKSNRDGLLAAALRCELMFKDLGILSGRVGVYGNYDLSVILGTISNLENLMPDLEFVGEAREDSIFMRAMETKDEAEVSRIRKMGKVTTDVVGKVADFLASCNVREDEVLLNENNSPLTVGDIHSKIHLWVAEHGAELPSGFIFSIGRDAGVPHSAGNPTDLMRLGQTIVFDIYPAEEGGGYYYDFTRTWSLGYATPEAQELFDQVKEIYDRLNDNFDLNVPFKNYQQMTCEYFESKGHQTQLHTKAPIEGYVHSLGHGVGLNIHERPFSSLTTGDDQRLVAGVVVTSEPGLYYPERGMGFRIEDTLWVRPDGKMEILADYPYDFVLPMKKWKKK